MDVGEKQHTRQRHKILSQLIFIALGCDTLRGRTLLGLASKEPVDFVHILYYVFKVSHCQCINQTPRINDEEINSALAGN